MDLRLLSHPGPWTRCINERRCQHVRMPTPPARTVARSRLAVVATALAVAATAVTGCGDDDSATTIDGAWARTSPMNADNGAAYFTISSDDDIRITSASVDASVAARVELHESVMADMADGDDMDDHDGEDHEGHDHDAEDHEGHDMGGAMMMQQVDGIDVAAGESVALEPGGLHVMLLELPDPLEVGETFDLTLDLADGDPITVEIEVRDEAP